MLSIISHQGSENLNHQHTTSHLSEWPKKKKKRLVTANIGEDVDKLEFITTLLEGMQIVKTILKNCLEVSNGVKHIPTLLPNYIPVSGMYTHPSLENHSLIYKSVMTEPLFAKSYAKC